MKRKSALEKAIESLEVKRAAIDAAIAELKEQQPKAPRASGVKEVALTRKDSNG